MEHYIIIINIGQIITLILNEINSVGIVSVNISVGVAKC